MNMMLFFCLLGSLAALSLWIGKKSSGGSKTDEDYFLMGRKLGLFSLVMTLLATQIGGGALLGAAEEAYVRGWATLFYPLGMVCGMVLLGLGYGARMRRLNLTTIPEIFERIYRSVGLRRFAALLSIASLFFILVAQAIAAKKFFISLGPSGPFLFISFWLVLTLYTVMGGLKAVVKTDILQTSFILIAFALVCVCGFGAKLEGGVATQMTSGPSTPWMSWLLMPLLFMLIEQDMGQRCFAAKNPRTVSIAAMIAAFVLLIVSLVPIYFGQLAAKMGLEITGGSSVFITAVQAVTNPTVSTVLICAILMAIISTADSLLCSISSHVACDFPKLKGMVSAQMITLLIGVSTLALAFLFDNVLLMLMFSYELAVSLLFVPITLGVWLPAPNKRSALVAMVIGGMCFIGFRGWTPPIPKELLTLFLSTTGFALSEWRGKRRVLS